MTVEFLASLFGPPAALAGLLYYFGYVRQQALCGYFGVDSAELGFSTQDYLVRSAGVAFLPLSAVALSALAAWGVHLLLRRYLGRISPRCRRARAVRAACAAVAVSLLAAGIVGLGLVDPGPYIIAPRLAAVALGSGALLVEYYLYLSAQARRRTRSRRARRRGGPRESSADSVVRRLLLVSIVLISIFWGFAVQASASGVRFARGFAWSLPAQTEAVVLSRDDLGIMSAQGVVRERVTEPGDGYLFRYSGLRLLIYHHQRWVLVPTGWSPGEGSVVVIYDDPQSVRVEYRRP